MGKNKNYCSMCEDRHYPPTGKKCQQKFSPDSDEGNSTAQKVGPTKKSKNCQSSKHVKAGPVSPHGQPPVTHKKDFYVKTPMAKHLGNSSDSGEDSSSSDDGDQNQQTVLQMKILTELQKVNARLDVVEDKVAVGDKKKKKHGTELSKLSKVDKKESKKKQLKGTC